ncbi:hypothetical protein [Sphingomonas sp. CCH15-F11]|uniref:hypothetical protein n=1 Tax=Sphingomonas sp. CCH15-F11 TaxID=1768785 RepID=UPI0008337D1E|nr:hypothetical protein [Sphingomonas sp. CCH15-F11]
MSEIVQMSALPGDSVTLTPLPDFPGLHPMWTWADGRAHYELAWRVDTGEIIRVRYTPVVVEPAMNANIPLTPRYLDMFASASLVDEDGAVIRIGGRGMVRPAMSFGQAVNGQPFDQSVFLEKIARILAEELIQFRDQVTAADMLLPPLTPPEPEPDQ